MVEGGRCSCQDDLDLEEGGAPPCCSAHLFTSVLLGVLACVLMTGGVFLAFHRWDPLWLIVSGIGVLLILIGSVLHCCGDAQDNSRARHRGPAGKGGCCGARPDHMSHGHHLVVNNGSLTEQLLPLSNARSVSQLSLNMLPGYFPPVVTTYGIEQHSAVVQNISRLAQQQSPGAQSTAGGKSFLLLSLPAGNEPAQQANVQNLVGYTVFQLDESSAMESPAPECTPPATATTAPSSPTTPPVQPPPLFKSVEVQTCHVWPTSGIHPNSSQNASCSNSSTELSPSEIGQNNKPLQKVSCNAGSIQSGVIKNNCMQKCSSNNSSTEFTSSVSIQNNKPLQNASCCSSPMLSACSDIVHNNHKQKSSSSSSSTELTTSEIVQNNKPLQNVSCSAESASSGIRQDNPMQKSSNSKNSSNDIATPGTSQDSSESDMPRMSHNNNVQKNSSDNSCKESSTSVSNPLIKISSHSVDSVATDPQQPSTCQTEDVSEVANCSTAAISQICDNAKSISNGATQFSRTLEDTPMTEAPSSVPVASSGESLLVVAIPEPSANNENLPELTTPVTTDNLVEVNTTTSFPPSTNSVDISSMPTISSVSPSVSTISSESPSVPTSSSVSVSSSDVRAMSTTSVDISPTTTTCDEDPSTSTSIYDVPRRLTISADVPAVSIIPTVVPLVSLDVSTDININDSNSSSDTTTFSGDPDASIDSTQLTVLDIGASRSDMDLNNLSDGEVDDNELLDRFSPPPCYDDAIHEGESAIGAFGLAYGTI